MTLFPGDFVHLGWHAPATSDPFRIINGPTVTDFTSSTITVSWELSEVCTGQVEYGTATGTYTDTTTEQDISGGYDLHVQTMQNLIPDTTYYFRVKSTNAAGTTVYSSEQSQATETAPVTGQFPDLLTLSYRTLQSVQMPGYLSTVTDPEFGTTIIRISDVPGQGHRYSTKPAWSATGRYIILDRLNNWRSLLDGESYELLQQNINTATHFLWDPVDDTQAWSTSGTSLLHYDISDNTYTRSTFDSLPYDDVNIGGGEGVLSNDGRYIPLKVQRGTTYGVAVYDTVNAEIHSEYLWMSTAPNNCSMAPSGTYVLVQGTTTGTGTGSGTWVYPLDLTTATRRQLSTSLSHRDVCRDPTDSFDQVVIPDTNPTGLYAYRMSDGTRIQLTNQTNRIHVSCRSHRRPGYAYVSHYSTDAEGAITWPGRGEVFSVKTDGSEFAQGRSYCQTHHAISYSDSAATVASVDPYGERVIWNSEWSSFGGLSNSIYAFVAGVTV